VNHSQEPAPATPSSTGPAYPPPAPYPPPVGSPGEYGWYAEGAGWLSEMPRPRRRPWRRTVAVCVVTGLVVAALGVPFGLLWSSLSPSVPVVRTAQADVVVRDPSPEQFVAADGWFAMLGVGFGILVAIAGWLLLRRDRGPALLLGVVLGALAAAPVAWQVGRRIGLGAYETWRAAATTGDTFDRPPDLHAYGTLLVPAFAAVIVCTLLAGWSNDPDLDTPGAHPGYGRDLPPGGDPGAGRLSWDSPGGPGPTTAPAPPAPGSATPPPG
jgi:hypothetical protein